MARPILGPLGRFLLAPVFEELRLVGSQVEGLRRTSPRVAIPIGDGDILVKAAVGWVLCSSTDHLVLAGLIDGGEFEHGTRLLVERLVRPGDVVVDVGAHLGLLTLPAGRALRGNGKVHAFEAYGPTARRLREAVGMNGLTGVAEVHEAAASNRDGRQALFLGYVSGHHSLYPLSPTVASDAPPVEVELVRLDEVLRDVPSIDLLKVDAEAAELEVLEGARLIVERSPEIALIVEYGPSHLARVGTAPADWFARFDDLGLEFRVIDERTGRVAERSIASLDDVGSVNLLFARPHARAWLRAAAD